MPPSSVSKINFLLRRNFLIALVWNLAIILCGSALFTVQFRTYRSGDLKHSRSFTLQANYGEHVFNCQTHPELDPCYQFNDIEPQGFVGGQIIA
jgi:hypothetical protein